MTVFVVDLLFYVNVSGQSSFDTKIDCRTIATDITKPVMVTASRIWSMHKLSGKFRWLPIKAERGVSGVSQCSDAGTNQL